MTGGRVALWDNAKLLVLVLVVVGHVIEQVKDVGYGPWALFAFLYIFHIPTIFLVAGVFARTQVDRKTVAAVAQLVVAYVAWEFINAGVRYLVEGETIRPGFLVNPSMALWFLLALATMRIVLPFLDMLRHPLLVSVAIALGAVLLPDVGTAFSAARTCAFLPFFVAGHVLARRGVFQDPRFREPSRLSRGAALGLLACGLLALVAVPRLWTGWDLTDWLFRKTSVTTLMADDRSAIPALLDPQAQHGWPTYAFLGLLASVILMAVSFAMVAAVLVLVPRSRGWWTPLGTRTLYIYLLHIPIVWTLATTGVVADLFAAGGLMSLAVVIAAAALVALALATRPVARLTSWAVEPRVDWLVFEPAPRPSDSGRSAHR